MGKCSLGCLHLSPVMLLVYFCVLNILMYLDRGVLSSLLPALQDDSRMHLSDFQSGILGSVFMFGFMIASPIFAYSSQTVHPFNLIAIGIAIWGGAVLFAAVSRRFWTLAAARMLSGIGEASFVCLASPILLSIAPSSKKNLWISIFYSALTIGYALGYVIAPPVKNSFNGWYVVFYFEAVASIPFVLIALFAYKDPKLIFKKDNKVPISVQFKILKRKPVFVLLVLGYGAYSFTVGGIAHWGPTMLQKQFSKGETTATFSLGAITIISGLFATVLGSVIYEKMIKPYRLQFENREIESRKYDYFRTEKAAKFALLVTSIACAIGCIGAIIAPTLGDPVYEVPFVVFLFCVALAEFSLFLGVGPLNVGIMASVDEELRPQAVAVNIFFMHLFGDFPSPFLIGAVNGGIGRYWGTVLTMGWLIFTVTFWSFAFNFSRFHGAPWEYIRKNFCTRNIVKADREQRLLTADKDSIRDDLPYFQEQNEKSVNKSVDKSIDEELK